MSLPQTCIPDLLVFNQTLSTIAYLLGRLAGHLIRSHMSSGQDRAGGRVTHHCSYHCSYCSIASALSWTLDLDAMGRQDDLGADAGLGLSPSDQPQESCLTILGLL